MGSEIYVITSMVLQQKKKKKGKSSKTSLGSTDKGIKHNFGWFYFSPFFLSLNSITFLEDVSKGTEGVQSNCGGLVASNNDQKG